MSGIVLRCLVVAGAGGVFAFVGSMDYADALTDEAIRKDQPLPPLLTHPLPCERWLAQWGPGETPKPRCVKPAEITEGVAR